MSISSTLADLSSRFTRIDQFEKALEFTLEAPLTGEEKTVLGIALLNNRKNMDWDRARLPEIRTHIANVKADQNRPGSGNDNDDDGLAWWAWLLIILGILLGVGLIGGGGWYAYKKYM